MNKSRIICSFFLFRRDWNLELCTSILPGVRDLIKSHYHWYNLTASKALEQILSNFGKMIYDNVGAKSIGVDLSQQARYSKKRILLLQKKINIFFLDETNVKVVIQYYMKFDVYSKIDLKIFRIHH